MSHPNRLTHPARWVPASVLVAGSLLFIAGGAQHPRASSAFGPVGTEQFWHAFASHITHHPNWIAIHVLILLGPILWALGLPRLAGDDASSDDVPRGGAMVALENLAARALLLGAALWTVAFVIDGFVAVHTAGSIATATDADLPALLAVFRFHQNTMVRLGLIAWVLIGLAMATYGATGIVRARSFGPRSLLGAWGVVVGVWPVVAALNGEFDPGPFTSPLWSMTALVSALWFAAFGVSLVVRERPRLESARRDAPSAPAELALQE